MIGLDLSALLGASPVDFLAFARTKALREFAGGAPFTRPAAGSGGAGGRFNGYS